VEFITYVHTCLYVIVTYFVFWPVRNVKRFWYKYLHLNVICLLCSSRNNVNALQEFSSYLTGNTPLLRYKDQPVNIVYENNCCLM
jgi:hypothetical protein